MQVFCQFYEYLAAKRSWQRRIVLPYRGYGKSRHPFDLTLTQMVIPGGTPFVCTGAPPVDIERRHFRPGIPPGLLRIARGGFLSRFGF
jgi:hypothetical protein